MVASKDLGLLCQMLPQLELPDLANNRGSLIKMEFYINSEGCFNKLFPMKSLFQLPVCDEIFNDLYHNSLDSAMRFSQNQIYSIFYSKVMSASHFSFALKMHTFYYEIMMTFDSIFYCFLITIIKSDNIFYYFRYILICVYIYMHIYNSF